MIESTVDFLVTFLVGMGLGGFYFSGLWLTVQRLPSVTSPVFLTYVSLLLRLLVTVLGFYLVMDGLWYRLASTLLGFLMMRSVLILRWGRPPHPQMK